MSDIDDNLEGIINPLKDLTKDNQITIQQILNNLLNGNENLDLKTHVSKPKQLSSLVVLAEYLKTNGYLKSYNTINNFITKFLRLMVSYNRLSRTEIIKALTPIENKQNSNNISIID